MVNKEKYIEKFKILHKEKTGQEISDLEASMHFENLITLVRAVYGSNPRYIFRDGKCPSCLKKINFLMLKEADDRKEFLISGLCKSCQDKTFKNHA